MAKNDFKPFATGKGANVTSQSDWEALPALLSGFTAGKASSAQVNKALRQASFIAAALAQYTASKSGKDVLDDGDLSGFIAKMSAAFGKDFQTLDATLTALAGLATGADKLPYFTGNDTAGQTDLTSVGRDIIGKASIADILTYLGLGETINLAKNAVPATRRVNSKPLTGDITLSAADVNAFALGMTGDYTLENDKSVGWNWKSGVYNVPTGGASSLILHFNMNIGSCPAVQFCVNYKNGGISYRSARDGFGFELDWTEFYTTTRKPSAGDVGALPVSGGVINGNLGIGTPNILGGSSIVLGDNDTGLKQNGDGLLDIYA
ncbi:phage tail protein, partial [Salmonella enterica]|nr:phage tail protein [Salmonella enterica]